ncbi:hypothetical protein Ade02nite_01190 [Paractinoplanes deccanensis]|uniref:Calcium-binding protein n=1 Tax=Paractinoplanes deccanensis TaxID=113561 RepID=A0ABQ3XUU2_9ACTN|nr:hypothetical protein [Actinoplanes deccanensis]GID71478.1 hypothetical protein Ade02nite_01190 [Actinoplanes deccanensis]
MRKIHLAAALVGAALTAAFATPAQAASTGVAHLVADADGDGDVVVFRAANGKANRVVVADAPGHYISIDDRFPIRAGNGCKAVKGDRTKVLCGVGELTEKVQVSTFDGVDTITNRTRLQLIAFGGHGNDTIRGGSSGDWIYGDGGNDKIYGNGGNDLIFGDAGRDTIYGGSGNDTLHGGSGNDRLVGGPGKDKLRGGPGYDRIA